MRVLVPLLCAVAVCVSQGNGFFEGTCPKEAPPPGVLLVAPGSHLSLTCGGQVTLDGLEVAVPSRTPTAGGAERTTPRTPSPAGVHRADATAGVTRDTVTARYDESAFNTVTGGNGQRIRPERSRRRRDSAARHASPVQEATPTGRTLQPTGGDGVTLVESDWPAGIVGGGKASDGDGDGEESGRGRKPQWRLNGRALRFRDGVLEGREGAEVSVPSVSVGHGGRYSCHRRGKMLSSVKVVVAAPPEQPVLSCYKRSPSSKIRCEWTPQQPLAVQSHCFLYFDKGTFSSFSRLNCTFSGHPLRCWCALDHHEEEKRVLHLTYLCVTSIAGNATSPLQSFVPLNIIKPDPPSAVAVRAVEGQVTVLSVSWRFPCSWKRHDQYYELVYEISYRPVASLDSHVLQKVDIKGQRYTITDVLPTVEYVIQVRAKDEYDGLWSEWSVPVYAYSWTAPPMPVWSNDVAVTVDSLFTDPEGSGLDYPSTSESGTIPDQVWLHSLWISGLCVLCSLALAAYAFRHREKFVSKLHNFNVVTVRPADPQHHTTTHPASTPQPREGHALITFTPASYKDPLPNEVEDQEEEEEDSEEDKRKTDGKPVKRSEAISFNNTSYFLLQTDRENVPQQHGSQYLNK